MKKEYLEMNQETPFLIFKKKSIIFLSLIVIVGLLIRFYYVPYGIPVTLDAFSGYFLYAIDISILGNLPPNYTLSQSGWGEFLSLFFMSFHSDNFIEYMNLQRTISVLLSGLTIIPVYFICKKFFNNNYSLIGASIFAFEPRIIINSTLGVSEPLYILAISLGILFFLNYNRKIIYLSFGFFGWATIIRPEGQFWFIAFSIIYFLRFRKNYKNLILYLLCIAVFLLVLSPIVIHRIQCCEDDAIIGRILSELSNYEKNPINSDIQSNPISYGPNFGNGFKLLGWSLVPIFIILVPIGLIPIFRRWKFPEYLTIVVPSILAFPIMYSLSIAPDSRYIFPIYPILCIVSLFGIKWIISNFKNKKLVMCIIISLIILTSITFLDFQKNDYTNDKEAYEISKIIINEVNVISKNSKVVEFFKVAEIENRWPISEYTGRLSDSFEIKRIPVNGFSNLTDLIIFGKNEGLTHIITDESEHTPKYMKDIFYNEKNYKYLIKEFDSSELGYEYNVKMYKIDYKIFDELQR